MFFKPKSVQTAKNANVFLDLLSAPNSPNKSNWFENFLIDPLALIAENSGRTRPRNLQKIRLVGIVNLIYMVVFRLVI